MTKLDIQKTYIDLDKFRIYLNYLGIQQEATQNRIINYYKQGRENFKVRSYLEQAIENFDDDIKNKIYTYAMFTNRREYINKNLEGEKSMSEPECTKSTIELQEDALDDYLKRLTIEEVVENYESIGLAYLCEDGIAKTVIIE